MGRYARLGIGALAIVFGAASVAVARHDPTGSFGGRSVRDTILELTAGWSLAAAGLAFWARRPRNRFGPLLTAAGLAWFLPEWSNPAVGSSLAFTFALMGVVACPPLVAHAALAYPRGVIASGLERGAVAFAYASAVGVLGLLSTLVFDPAAQGCLGCPANAALVDADPGAFDASMRWGLRLGCASMVVLALLIAWRLAHRVAPAAIAVPVLAPATLYVALTAWALWHDLGAHVLANDTVEVRLDRKSVV